MTTCQHGRTGYCHDEGPTDHREEFDLLHRYAYDWATRVGLDPDEGERYAAHYAGRFWDEHYAPEHRDEYEWWRAQYLTLTDVASLLGVKPKTVSSYTTRGYLPRGVECRCCGSRPVWRRDRIEAWMRERRAATALP